MFLLNIWSHPWLVETLTALAVIVISGLSTLLGIWFKKLADKTTSKLKDEKYGAMVMTIKDLIQSAVLAIQQSFVDSLKKEGKFDKEAQKEAFNKALVVIKANVTKEGLEILNELYGDAMKWIELQIEAALALMKGLK